MAKGNRTKANGIAQNAEQKLLNSRLSQMAIDRFIAGLVTKNEEITDRVGTTSF